jgi:acetyl esterase/lipase
MRNAFFQVGFLFAAVVASLAAEPIDLWPQGAPGEIKNLPAESETSKPGKDLVGGKTVMILGNVSRPTITVYAPPADKNTGAAVVVCPGGGYHILAWNLEGTEVCDWLNSIGVTGVLLKYRVPIRPNQERYVAPLQDAQRALSLTRLHAGEWKIDPHRVGILGFSAGGHLAATASCRFDNRAYRAVDEADQISCRPDFAVLIYPAYLTVPDRGNKMAVELTVTSNTPPTFLAQTEDDRERVENSIYYCLALKAARVPVELHVFASGGHGYGLRPSKNSVSGWPALAQQWLSSCGFLTAK